MRQRGLTYLDYYSPSRSDVGVTAANRWFDIVGYNQLWEQRMGKEAAAAAAARPEPSLEQLLNQWDRHTKHCTVCQKVRGSRVRFVVGSLFQNDSGSHSPHSIFHLSTAPTNNNPTPPTHKKTPQGMQTLERVAAACRAAAVALGVLAACLAAAAHAITPGAVAAGAAAVGAAWLAGRIMQHRYEKFINSINVWRRDGGLSMVPGQAGPIQL
jgi:hypothetical protein